jgi:hypothetical protein
MYQKTAIRSFFPTHLHKNYRAPCSSCSSPSSAAACCTSASLRPWCCTGMERWFLRTQPRFWLPGTSICRLSASSTSVMSRRIFLYLTSFSLGAFCKVSGLHLNLEWASGLGNCEELINLSLKVLVFVFNYLTSFSLGAFCKVSGLQLSHRPNSGALTPVINRKVLIIEIPVGGQTI